MQNIILCINNKLIENTLIKHIKNNGYNIISCDDGSGLIRTLRSREVSLVILDTEVRSIPTIDLVNIIYTEKICPVILVSNAYEDYIDWIERGWIYTSLSMPIDQLSLLRAIKGAIANGERLLALERENLKLKNELNQRKLIERAKGIIMEKRHSTEKEAYDYLRNLSMKKGVSMDRIAKAIVDKYS